jgi:hypothetical protein
LWSRGNPVHGKPHKASVPCAPSRKLAALRPGRAPDRRGRGGQHGGGGGGGGGLPSLLAGRLGPPLVPGELGATFSLEPEVRSALATSRRVGALLLKAEEQEMAAVAAAADDLLKREYRWASPCGGGRVRLLLVAGWAEAGSKAGNGQTVPRCTISCVPRSPSWRRR